MTRSELLSRAKAKRDTAEHVMTLRWGLSLECDRDRLKAYAEGLEDEADELEAQASKA